MKIVRFSDGYGADYGILKGDVIHRLKGSPFDPAWDKSEPEYDGDTFSKNDVKILAPCEPTKYLGVGLNFHEAAKSQNRPVPDYPITFMKPNTAIIGSGDSIVLTPKENSKYLYEGELAVVIGRKTRNVNKKDALNYVLGYTCSNDVTDFPQFGKDDLRVKCADTFGPIGPCIETDINPDNVVIRSWLNGEKCQEGNTKDMIFNVAYMIAFFSDYMTLMPGDIISMGTPVGLAAIHPGDRIRVEVEGVGFLDNTVVSA